MTIFEMKKFAMKILFKALSFIKDNLYEIHTGDIGSRLASSSKIALALSPFAYVSGLITDWFSLNSGYVIFVFIAIIIDHLVGTWVHAFIKRDFQMKKNITGFFTKTFLAIAVGILAEGITYIIGDGIFVSDYFSILSRLMVFIYPAGSALMNISVITKGVFPPTSWMEKIKKFNSNMDMDQFREGANNKNKQDVQNH